ncbi:minor tail protein [Mycobacterium phage Kimona]|uniref:Minor tail protein n=1 Tax=Mycobacterium phage Kimona TaxID=2024295 RepID=A0A249XU72_9CAUD|nr:minor tail protein [Mycobacterium phage Kimona]ASZ75462.1 minor tail protein [Mycobacterium phage Kimona]
MAYELEDTQPLQLGWDIDEDGDIEGVEERVPEPLVLRGAILTGIGLAGAILGKTLDVSWVEPAVAFYAVAVPMGLALWGHRHVTPVKK